MDIVKFYSTSQITIKGTFESPLFRANDVAKVLDITNIKQNLSDFDDTEKTLCVENTAGGKQHALYLTEQGLCKIIFRSKKEIAIRFQKWVFDVIREIRIKGSYELKKELEETRQTLEAMQKKVEKLETENNVPKMYIFDTDTRPGYVGLKKLKIGVTEKSLRSRAKPFRQTHEYGEMIFSIEVPTHVNLKQCEDWVHMLLKPYRSGDREIFEVDIDLAKMWMIYVLRMVQVADCKDENQKRIMLAKLVDAHNEILDFESGSALKCEASTQTEDMPTEEQEVAECNKFDMFIENECVVGNDLEVSSTDISGKFRIWAKTATKEQFHMFLDYLNVRFRPVRLSVQNKDQVVNGFRGVTIKRNEVTLSIAPSDPEIFLWHMCDYKPSGKVLLSDLYQEYHRWAGRIGKTVDDSDLREYLADSPHVLIANVWSHNGNGRGVYGICLKNDPSQQKHRKPSTTSKTVQKRDVNGNVVDVWSTIAKAAQAQGVATARMSRMIKDCIAHNGFYFVTVDNP